MMKHDTLPQAFPALTMAATALAELDRVCGELVRVPAARSAIVRAPSTPSRDVLEALADLAVRS